MKLQVLKQNGIKGKASWEILHENQELIPHTLTASHLEIVFTPRLPESTQYYRHGYTSWSATNWWFLDRQPWRVWNNPARTLTAEDASTDCADKHQSYLVTAISLDTEQCLLVGSLQGKSALFQVNQERILGTSLDNDSSQNLQWWVGIGEEAEVFSKYAQALRNSLPSRHDLQISPGAVWSSWYSWFEEITADKIREEIAPAARNGYKVIQIDDGWEEKIGDWQANQDFPQGMQQLATEISTAGLTPGLWIAPFIATADAPIVHDHPEYFVHREDGSLQAAGYNWGQYYYALDTSHPGAQEWLKSLIKQVQNWGYRYLKLDFLNAATIPGVRYQDIDREEAYRIGIEILREHAPNSYLLGSGAVIAPSLGYLDGIRVGPDTAPYWDNTDRKQDPTGPALRNALRNSLARVWLKDIIEPDPDVVFFRTHGSLLSPEVNQVSHDLARVCGVLSCSDPDSWLLPEQRQLVKEICEEFIPESSQTPKVTRLSRYRFQIGSRLVDFEPWINPRGRISDRLLVK